jgi:hypothetical protein
MSSGYFNLYIFIIRAKYIVLPINAITEMISETLYLKFSYPPKKSGYDLETTFASDNIMHF